MNGIQQIIEYCFSSLTHEDVLNITQNKIKYYNNEECRKIALLSCQNIPYAIANIETGDCYHTPIDYGIMWNMPNFTQLTKRQNIQSVYQHVMLYEDFIASQPGEKYAVELWMAVVFHNAGSFWQTLMYDVINQKVKYVEGTSFTAWRPSLYMLHPEWMIHHGYYETAQLSESHVFGIWKEPIEQIIDWSKPSCVNFSTSTYHLALPWANRLRDLTELTRTGRLTYADSDRLFEKTETYLRQIGLMNEATKIAITFPNTMNAFIQDRFYTGIWWKMREIDLLQFSGDYTQMMGAPGYPREDMIRLIMNEVNMECSPYVLFMNRHQKMKILDQLLHQNMIDQDDYIYIKTQVMITKELWPEDQRHLENLHKRLSGLDFTVPEFVPASIKNY